MIIASSIHQRGVSKSAGASRQPASLCRTLVVQQRAKHTTGCVTRAGARRPTYVRSLLLLSAKRATADGLARAGPLFSRPTQQRRAGRRASGQAAGDDLPANALSPPRRSNTAQLETPRPPALRLIGSSTCARTNARTHTHRDMYSIVYNRN